MSHNGSFADMTISEPKSNEKISLCFKTAIEKLDRVDEDAKKEKSRIEADANKKKTQIVQDLAKDLEGKIATDSICNEIVHQLRGKVSETLIRRCLDKKYKEKHRIANARKQKKKHESTVNLAAQVPLEQQKSQQLMIATTQEGKSVITDETSKDRKASIPKRTDTDDNSKAEATATNQLKIVHETTPYTETDKINGTSLIAIDKLARDRSGLEKCPNCSVLRLRNQELRLQNQGLEEALRQATPLLFSKADTLHSTGNPNEESEIEFSLPYQYVQQYMAAEYRRGKSKVWFSIKINVKVNKVTSAKVGRISESEVNWNDIN